MTSKPIDFASSSRATQSRNVLCLSGGGSYGAFSAGVMYGWTQAGTRPTFDVVTGVSTGALLARVGVVRRTNRQSVLIIGSRPRPDHPPKRAGITRVTLLTIS